MTYRFFVGNEEIIPNDEFRREMTDKFAKAFGLKRVEKGEIADGKNLHLEIEAQA